MLEKPDIKDETLISALGDKYGLQVVQLEFLPLGADRHTAVYRAVSSDGELFFVRLRGAVFDEITVILPKFLHQQGVPQIIAPLETRTGDLWVNLGKTKLVLYPFIEGYNGYDIPLSDRNLHELGSAFKGIHTVEVPPAIQKHIPQESFTPQWRRLLSQILERVSNTALSDSLAVELAATLKVRQAVIQDLVSRAERLAQDLAQQDLAFVLCHADIHAGNILVDSSNEIYIVDWDDPILAPKERDLMYVGAGLWGNWHPPQREEALFYQGYGATQIDPAALAYYRYERIVQDLALFSQSILGTEDSLEDRAQGLHYLKTNFQPNGTIEIAYNSDGTLKGA